MGEIHLYAVVFDTTLSSLLVLLRSLVALCDSFDFIRPQRPVGNAHCHYRIGSWVFHPRSRM